MYSAAYDPYGGIQKTWENIYDPKLKFSGKERDGDTGLDYFGARYYGYSSYRFISVDPVLDREEAISNPQLWNLYSYCRNNPVTFMDPDGRDLIPVNLPGIGKTYLDDASYPLVQRWIYKTEQAGIKIMINEAFRTAERQRELHKDPNAITPARPGKSLHEAGFAVDINISCIPANKRKLAVKLAEKEGINWGGYFRPVPDPPHFYKKIHGGMEKRAELIERARSQYKLWISLRNFLKKFQWGKND